MSRSELDGEILAQMDDGGFRGLVTVGRSGARSADCDSGDGGGYDYAGGIFDRTLLFQ